MSGLPPSGSPKQTSKKHSILTHSKDVVIVVDPYSSGACLVKEIMKYGYHIIALWDKDFPTKEKTKRLPLSCKNKLRYYAEITEDKSGDIQKTLQLCQDTVSTDNLHIVAVIAGYDAGVDLSDKLSEIMGLRTNGTIIKNRRSKQVQQELIKAAGLRSLKQVCSNTYDDNVDNFLKSSSYPVVVKPVESTTIGTHQIKLCYSYEDAKKSFDSIASTSSSGGGTCGGVLCTEFLQGKEYVVDFVSRDGIHKTCMVWTYDKRPANGSSFVYYGMVPVDLSTSPEVASILISYCKTVLDALGVKNGPSHGEIMMTSDGPCLIEMNYRLHGNNGIWRPLCKSLCGYTQIDLTISAYLENNDVFDQILDKPPSPFLAYGQVINLVSYTSGKVISIPGKEIIQQMPSFLWMESYIKSGMNIDYTTDLSTCPGSVILMHKDKHIYERDLTFIRYLEEINSLFIIETKTTSDSEFLKRPHADELILGGSTHDDEEASAAAQVVEKQQQQQQQQQQHRRVYSSDGFKSLVRTFSNDRPELMGNRMLKKRMTTVDASKEVVIVTNPYSTGCWLVKECLNRTYKVIALYTKVFNESEMKTHVPLRCEGLTYTSVLVEGNTLEETQQLCADAASKESLRIVAVIAGGESGVDLADALSEKMNVRTNGTDIPNRRDKKLQQELIKKYGLRSVRQAGGDKFDDVKEFLQTEEYPVVLKPVESAGSDGVKLCHTYDEAYEHFHVLMKSQMVNGGDCPSVLCQEFLRGKEYVVDHVSRDGIHKTTMVWVYDKRPANGSAFVYYGCIPIDSNSSEAKLVISYIRAVLDAIGVKHGPSHGEVMMTPDGPCLVEMNCRAHGGDGNWQPLCQALCGGYSQVEGAIDSYLDVKAFYALPDRMPSPFKASGQEVILVSYSGGIVETTPGFDIITKLESFVYLESGIKKGSKVAPTIDLFTCIGSVILMHRNNEILQRDIATIRHLETTNQLFVYKPKENMNILRSLSGVGLQGLAISSSSDDSSSSDNDCQSEHKQD